MLPINKHPHNLHPLLLGYTAPMYTISILSVYAAEIFHPN